MDLTLSEKIREVRSRGEKLFCAFLTLGYPNLSVTEKLIRGFEGAGVDIVELGFPFSDPLADGPTIQHSSEMALSKGVTVEDAFSVVKKLRKQGVSIPILFFSYMNPVMHYGFKAFAKKARESGFDGLIIPDLPPDAERGLQDECRKNGLSQVYLIAPTTRLKRARKIINSSQGFVYYVSLRGVTGARKSAATDIKRHLKILRKGSDKPFLIGFGVSNPKQAKIYSRMSEGVIVGSAIIEHLRRSHGKTESTIRYIRQMVRSVKGLKNGSLTRS